MWPQRAQRSNSGLSDRMSRSETALLPCVTPTPSLVMTMDSKSTFTEVKNFNIIADDGFQAAAGAFHPTVRHRCQVGFVADDGWILCNGGLKLVTTARSCD